MLFQISMAVDGSKGRSLLVVGQRVPAAWLPSIDMLGTGFPQKYHSRRSPAFPTLTHFYIWIKVGRVGGSMQPPQPANW